jgi:ABC-type protease/lipase transport system fused ATPase/permease subunit
MTNVDGTLAAIDRAIADWESWRQAKTAAENVQAATGIAPLPWQRRWLTNLLRRERRP